MGSLLPGWDERAPGMPPKEFQDFDENEEEDQGYFAAYAKMKKMQREADPTSPIAMPAGRTSSLSRRSSMSAAESHPRSSPSTLLSRASMPSSFGGGGASGMMMSPPAAGGARSLSRAETMGGPRMGPYGAGLRGQSLSGGYQQGSAGGGGGGAGGGGASTPQHLQRMYSMPMTRGERSDVLAGLTLPTSPSALSSSGTPHSLDAYKTQHADKDKADYQWWRHFDSAAMNERPDEPVSHDKAFTPQFEVTGQGVHFHEEELSVSTIQAH